MENASGRAWLPDTDDLVNGSIWVILTTKTIYMATLKKKTKAAVAARSKKDSGAAKSKSGGAGKSLTLKKRSKLAAQATVKKKTSQVLRFAQPFYTTTPVENRPTIPGIGKRLVDYLATQLQPIPAPLRDPSMALAEVVGDAGASAIESWGTICFHATGDTGNEKSDWPTYVSEAMSKDYDPAKPATSPAFFLHLGDVNYYDNTDQGYHAQFYVPYTKYPGKIVAIPGNHDGELFKGKNTPTGQKTTLEAFMNNFCLPKPSVPPAAGTIYREMVAQPGVYWVLDTPFVSIVGLYSNVAEGQGFISGASIGQDQKNWLVKTLTNIKKARDGGV